MNKHEHAEETLLRSVESVHALLANWAKELVTADAGGLVIVAWRFRSSMTTVVLVIVAPISVMVEVPTM